MTIPNGQDEIYTEFDEFFKTQIASKWKTGYIDLEKKLNNLSKDEKNSSLKPRFIRDPLWGEIRLSPICSFFLDTFFMQRLRWITHMGFVNMVFPASNHKRFDHSLGTLAVISYILDERFLKRRQKSYETNIKNTFSSWESSFSSYFDQLEEKIKGYKGYNEEKLSDIIELISPLQSLNIRGLNKDIIEILTDLRKFYTTEKDNSEWEEFVKNSEIYSLLSQISTKLSKDYLDPVKSEFRNKDEMDSNNEYFRNKICEELKLTMLLHDIGHYPYSHVFENFLKRNKDDVSKYRNIDFIKGAPHEIRTRDIILGIDPVINELINSAKTDMIYNAITHITNFLPEEMGLGENLLDPFLIAVSITGKSQFCLSKLINGPLDSDKMDYLGRDQYFAISPTIFKIFDRIFRNMEIDVKNNDLVFNYKIINTILKVIITRQLALNEIIFHPTNLCAQALMISLLNLVLLQYKGKFDIEILKRFELMDEKELYISLKILNGINYALPSDNKYKEYQEVAEELLYGMQFRNFYKSAYEISMIDLAENAKNSNLKKFIDDNKEDNITSFFILPSYMEDASKLIKKNLPAEYAIDLSEIISIFKKYKSGLLVFHNSQKIKKITTYLEKLKFKLSNGKINDLNTILKSYLQSYYKKPNLRDPNIFKDKKSGFKIIDKLLEKFRLDLFRFFDIINEKLYFYVAPEIVKKAEELFDLIEKSEYKWDIILFILLNYV